jgi:hypothetical protein
MSVAVDRSLAALDPIMERAASARRCTASAATDDALRRVIATCSDLMDALSALSGPALKSFTSAHPPEVTAARKHEISEEFVAAMNRMEKGEIDFAAFIALVDETENNDPGDQRQKNFYAAIRELARKVAKGEE